MFTEPRSTSVVTDIVIMIVILLLCIHQMFEKNILKTLQETWYLLIVCLMFLITCNFLYRLRLFFEEIFYINTEYHGDFLSVIKATLNFNVVSWIVTGITAFTFLMLAINLNYSMLQLIQMNPLCTLFAFAFSLLLLRTINVTVCRATRTNIIFNSGGLDPGTAMAGSYFYGYLKIVLPASGGNERAGIKTALEKYEANNGNINIPVKKLFILIPSSSYIPPDLKEISDDWMESAKSLETIAIDRAGVKNRTYHNTMYRINARDSKNGFTNKVFYIATEGATPLKTFSEVQDKSHRYAPLYREYNREIVRNFYVTLQNLLNDNPDCRDYCDLIYYEGIYDYFEIFNKQIKNFSKFALDFVDGKSVNPAKILLKRIASYINS